MTDMAEGEDNGYWTLAINAVSIALVAALATHVFHESCHAIAVVLVGARLEWINFLFGIQYTPVVGMHRWGEMIIAGNAALMNIFTGMIAVVLFSRRWVMRRPTLRLFLFYFGAYSLLTGFGILILDAFFYQPGGQNLGDWARVLELLGGNRAVWISTGVVGLAGEGWVYSWLADSTLRFGGEIAERYQRARLAVPLLMAPYQAINAIITIFSLRYGVVIDTVMMTWCGYIAFLVAFFDVVFWTKVRTPPPDATPLPDQLNWAWCIGAAAALGIASFVLLPTIYF